MSRKVSVGLRRGSRGRKPPDGMQIFRLKIEDCITKIDLKLNFSRKPSIKKGFSDGKISVFQANFKKLAF